MTAIPHATSSIRLLDRFTAGHGDEAITQPWHLSTLFSISALGVRIMASPI